MPRKHQRYVKKRKGFNGISFHDMKKRKTEEEEVEEEPTASERKLAANASLEAMESEPSPMREDSRHDLEGFYVISGHQLTAALQTAHVCPGGEFLLKN